MAHTHDVLIIGRGIAGAVLAEACLQRGLRVHLFDRKRPGNASLAAAGVMNPVVLRRDVLAWRAAELVPLADAFYRRMEARLGASFWHPLPLVKLFALADDARRWEQAMQDPATAPFLSRAPQSGIDVAPLHAPHGHGTVHGTAWLDVATMLEAQRTRLLTDGGLTEMDLAPEAIAITGDGVRIGDRSAPWLVRCEGPFATLPGLVPVKGETLLVRIPGLRIDRLVHRGIFLLPQGDEHYRIGATFSWSDVWAGPTDEARAWLVRKLQAVTDAEVEVLDQRAGVRPTAKDRRPILGITGPREAALNGLGARGVSLAPWCAAHLLEHLWAGVPLDPAVDVRRFR